MYVGCCVVAWHMARHLFASWAYVRCCELAGCGHRATPVYPCLVHVSARGSPTRWGPSVLCAVWIEVAEGSPTRQGPISLLVVFNAGIAVVVSVVSLVVVECVQGWVRKLLQALAVGLGLAMVDKLLGVVLARVYWCL